MASSILRDRAGSVAKITLNRPEARNALTFEAKVSLLDALRDAASDERIRALIITGAGTAFSAGQDLRELADLQDRDAGPQDYVAEQYNPIAVTITSMPKPVIAAVNGAAAGAGAAIALACDFRIAARRASLLLAFARMGLGPAIGVSWILPRLVGLARATELLMLAEPIDADRALSLGLVTSVVADEELPAAAEALGQRLAAGPTLAYAAIKESLAYSAAHGLHESLAKEAELARMLGSSPDHRAAVREFRPPAGRPEPPPRGRR